MDTSIPSSADLAGDQAVISRAQALQPAVAAASNEIEDGRRIAPALLDRLHEAKLFRLLLPRSANGIETDPVTFFHVIETIASGDASTAWCLSQAGGCAMTAAYLAPPVANEIFGRDPRAVLAWGPGPKARAVAVEGGYKVTGVYAFASGCRHATWLGAHAPIYHADGSPLLGADGKIVERTLLVPAGDVAWTDIWNVVGLRGTASDQFALTDHFVQADHTFSRDFAHPANGCREPRPALPHVGDDLLRGGLRGRGTAASPAARSTASSTPPAPRSRAARRVRSATAPWSRPALPRPRSAFARRGPICCSRLPGSGKRSAAAQRSRMDHRIVVRGASTNAIHKAREAVDFAYNAAGATAIFESHPLERRFRDIHTVTQQLQGRLSHFETVGAWMMGADTDLTWV